MTDKKDGPGKVPERGATDPVGQKRPFATIDLKATEVRVDDAKVKADAAKAAAAGAAGGAATVAATVLGSGQAAAAANIAAAAKAVSEPPEKGAAKPAGAKTTDDKPAAPRTGPAWSVEAAIGDRGPGGAAATAATRPAVAPTAKSGTAIGRFLSHGLAGVLGGLLALTGAQHVLPMLGLDAPRAPVPGPSGLSPDVAGRLAGLEKSMRERLVPSDAARPNPALDAGLVRLEEMAKSVSALSDAQARLGAENAALKEAIARQPATPVEAERIAKLEEQLASIAAVAAADPQRAGRIPQLAQLTGQVRDLETALNNRLATLRKELAPDVDNRLASTAEAGETAKSGTVRLDREVSGVKSEATRLTQRVDQIKTGTDKLEQILKSLQEEAGLIKTALETFKGEVDGRLKATAKPADVAGAVNPIAARIAALEQSLLGVMKSEDDRKSNTERIVLSLELGNLKRAMERGSKYDAELAEVRRVAGDRIDLKALERYQGEGVPTLATLNLDFRKIANAVMDADAEQPGATVVDRMLNSAKTVVRVRKTEYAATDVSAEALVARMEAALKDGRLGDVLGEARKLTDKARAPAVEWLRKVEARQTVEGALAAIDAALKSSLGAGVKPDAAKGSKQ